jgi:hypothetical protein
MKINNVNIFIRDSGFQILFNKSNLTLISNQCRLASDCWTPLVRFFFNFEPLEKIQDFLFLLKTHMKLVDGSFLIIHAKFEV